MTRTDVPPAVVLGRVRAMASDVTLFAPGGDRVDGSHATGDAVEQALAVFTAVHATCTRFDPTSPLMRANAHPGRWHRVPRLLVEAVAAAHHAYLATEGRFDPRVHDDLVRLGYDRSLPFEAGGVQTGGAVAGRGAPTPWAPRCRAGRWPRLHLGGAPVDLGGIGKSLAVRWAAGRLTGALEDFLLDAGGDCYAVGGGPEGDGWRIGVEDPAGGTRPVAVLAVRDLACATSSIRLRRWRAGGAAAHHLIDPTTGRPGGAGLLAVTVVADDPVDAEVEAKALFLRGAGGVDSAAARAGTAALWVTEGGTVATSTAMAPHVVWRAP